MWPVLIVQQDFGNARTGNLVARWIDFAADWGDTASIVALLITLIGFPTLWWMQRKIKVESRKALYKVALAFLSDALQQISWQIHLTQESARSAMWLRAFDLCNVARQAIIRIQQNPHLTEDERVRMLVEADNLKQVKGYIERNKLGPDPSPRFDPDKNNSLESAHEFITIVQARLDAIRWES